jgi:hypothetical protein
VKKPSKKQQVQIDKAVKDITEYVRKQCKDTFKRQSINELIKATKKSAEGFLETAIKDNKIKMFSDLKVVQDGDKIKTTFKYLPLPVTTYTVTLPDGFTEKDAEDIINIVKEK